MRPLTPVMQFETWPDAFDFCRDADRPIVVSVGGEVRKIYPSGHSAPAGRRVLAEHTTTGDE